MTVKIGSRQRITLLIMIQTVHDRIKPILQPETVYFNLGVLKRVRQ